MGDYKGNRQMVYNRLVKMRAYKGDLKSFNAAMDKEANRTKLYDYLHSRNIFRGDEDSFHANMSAPAVEQPDEVQEPTAMAVPPAQTQAANQTQVTVQPQTPPVQKQTNAEAVAERMNQNLTQMQGKVNESLTNSERQAAQQALYEANTDSARQARINNYHSELTDPYQQAAVSKRGGYDNIHPELRYGQELETSKTGAELVEQRGAEIKDSAKKSLLNYIAKGLSDEDAITQIAGAMKRDFGVEIDAQALFGELDKKAYDQAVALRETSRQIQGSPAQQLGAIYADENVYKKARQPRVQKAFDEWVAANAIHTNYQDGKPVEYTIKGEDGSQKTIKAEELANEQLDYLSRMYDNSMREGQRLLMKGYEPKDAAEHVAYNLRRLGIEKQNKKLAEELEKEFTESLNFGNIKEALAANAQKARNALITGYNQPEEEVMKMSDKDVIEWYQNTLDREELDNQMQLNPEYPFVLPSEDAGSANFSLDPHKTYKFYAANDIAPLYKKIKEQLQKESADNVIQQFDMDGNPYYVEDHSINNPDRIKELIKEEIMANKDWYKNRWGKQLNDYMAKEGNKYYFDVFKSTDQMFDLLLRQVDGYVNRQEAIAAAPTTDFEYAMRGVEDSFPVHMFQWAMGYSPSKVQARQEGTEMYRQGKIGVENGNVVYDNEGRKDWRPSSFANFGRSLLQFAPDAITSMPIGGLGAALIDNISVAGFTKGLAKYLTFSKGISAANAGRYASFITNGALSSAGFELSATRNILMTANNFSIFSAVNSAGTQLATYGDISGKQLFWDTYKGGYGSFVPTTLGVNATVMQRVYPTRNVLWNAVRSIMSEGMSFGAGDVLNKAVYNEWEEGETVGDVLANAFAFVISTKISHAHNMLSKKNLAQMSKNRYEADVINDSYGVQRLREAVRNGNQAEIKEAIRDVANDEELTWTQKYQLLYSLTGKKEIFVDDKLFRLPNAVKCEKTDYGLLFLDKDGKPVDRLFKGEKGYNERVEMYLQGIAANNTVTTKRVATARAIADTMRELINTYKITTGDNSIGSEARKIIDRIIDKLSAQSEARAAGKNITPAMQLEGIEVEIAEMLDRNTKEREKELINQHEDGNDVYFFGDAGVVTYDMLRTGNIDENVARLETIVQRENGVIDDNTAMVPTPSGETRPVTITEGFENLSEQDKQQIHTDGTFKPVNLKNGEQVFLTGGNLVVDQYGAIDEAKSDQTVYYMGKDGLIHSAHPSKILSAEEPIAAKDFYKAVSNVRPVEPEGRPEEVVGAEGAYEPAGEGVAETAQPTEAAPAVTSPTGRYAITEGQELETPTGRIGIDRDRGDGTFDVTVYDDANRTEDYVRMSTDQIAEAVTPEVRKSIATPEESPVVTTDETPVVTPTETPATEAPITPAEKPVERTQAQQTYDIVAEGWNHVKDDVERQKGIVGDINATIEGISKKIEKISKQANASIDMTDTAAMNKRSQARQELMRLQQDLEHWKAVKEEYNAQMRKAQEAAAEKNAEEAADFEKKKAELAAKKKAEEEAAKASAAEGATPIEKKWSAAPKHVGRAKTINLPDGTTLKGHYVLTQAGAATASHDPFRNYASSEGFPTDEAGNNVNDRDYQGDSTQRKETELQAAKYDGRAIDSMPVVSKRGIVYSGNGRTMAGDIAAKNGTDTAYVEQLKADADMYGFTPEQVAEMGEHPRLVFIPDEELPYTTATFAKFNAKAEKGQGNTAKAIKASKQLSTEDVQSIVSIMAGSDGEGGYSNIESFFASEKGTNDLILALQERGILQSNEVADYVENGKLNNAGKDFVKNLLLGTMFDADAIKVISTVPSVKNALVSAMNPLLENTRLGDYSTKTEISNAARLIAEAKAKGYNNVADYLRQTSLFGQGADQFTEFEKVLAQSMDAGVESFRKALSEYNKTAAMEKDGSLFGAMTPDDVKKAFVTEFENKNLKTSLTKPNETREQHNQRVEREGGLLTGMQENLISESEANMLDTFAKGIGRTIVVLDLEHAWEDLGADGQAGFESYEHFRELCPNGYFWNGRVVMIAESKAKRVCTMGHEFTHLIRRSGTESSGKYKQVTDKLWNELVKYVRDSYGEEYQELYDKKMECYKFILDVRAENMRKMGISEEAIEAYKRDYIEEEIVSDWAGYKMFQDAAEVQRFIGKVREEGGDSVTICERMLNYLKAVIEKIKNLVSPDDKQLAAFQNAKDIWETLYKAEAAKVREQAKKKQMETGAKEVKLSLNNTDKEKDNDERDVLSQEFSSAATSRNQIPAATTKIAKWGGFKEGAKNLDLGGGAWNKASEFIAEQGAENYVYDMFNRSREENERAFAQVQNGGFETVTCNNVLNVIQEPSIRENVIKQAAKSVKKDGTVFFSVYEGDKTGNSRQTRDGWQEHRKTADYLNEIRPFFKDVELKSNVIICKDPIKTDEAQWFMEENDKTPVRFSLGGANLSEKYQTRTKEEMASGNVPFNGKILQPHDDSKFKVVDDDKKIFNNWRGNRQHRYKDNVGKEMSGYVYVHKDYADEIVPSDILKKAKAVAKENGFEYNSICYSPKTPDKVRFDEAPDFDTAREPITGDYLNVDTKTGEIKKGHSDQVWHNKWMWVKDDYKGFDVNEAYEWSKTWNQKITNPDGYAYKWEYLLEQAGLPVDWRGSALSSEPTSIVSEPHSNTIDYARKAIDNILNVQKPEADRTDWQGKAAETIYKDGKLVDKRKYIQEWSKTIGGEIGNASRGAYDTSINGIANPELAKRISDEFIPLLKDYRKALVRKAKENDAAGWNTVFEKAIKDVDDAIKWYKEFGEGKHTTLSDHDGIKFSFGKVSPEQDKDYMDAVSRIDEKDKFIVDYTPKNKEEKEMVDYINRVISDDDEKPEYAIGYVHDLIDNYPEESIGWTHEAADEIGKHIVNVSGKATADKMVKDAATEAMNNTKVIDDNGEIKKVYRGNRFGTINEYEERSNGIFFTDDDEAAYDYAYYDNDDKSEGNVGTFYLDIQRPFVIDAKGNDWFSIGSNHNGLMNPNAPTTDSWAKYIKENHSDKYDGVIVKSVNDGYGRASIVTDYVVFKPTQIKSADTVTYDKEGKVIPLSERFNKSNPDVRFSFVSKEGYERKAAYAARRNADNESVAISNGMAEEQAELVTRLAALRHRLHTSIDRLVQNGKYNYILDDLRRLQSELIESGLPKIDGNINIPVYDDSDYIDIDSIDELNEWDDVPEAGTDEWQDWYDDNYSRIYDEYETLNRQIEDYLGSIDKKYGTSWKPSGFTRFSITNSKDMLDGADELRAQVEEVNRAAEEEKFPLEKAKLMSQARDMKIVADAIKWYKEFGEGKHNTLSDHDGIKFSFGKVSPEQDKDYMKAIESGDTDTAERMVKEAAKNAMPDTKVVDEDGNPLVVYHGSRNPYFTVFGAPNTEGYFDNPVWLSTKKYYSDRYAEPWLSDLRQILTKEQYNRYQELEDQGLINNAVYSVYADIKNPLDCGNIDLDLTDEVFEDFAKKVNSNADELKRIWGRQAMDDQELIWELTNCHSFAKLAQEAGYDGLTAIEDGIRTYAVFSDNQVKSAVPVTRDGNGNVIPLSERFNKKNPDIRFSIGGTSKRLRDGSKIIFTKRNPTQTFNAIEKYIEGLDNKELVEGAHQASTGSRYMDYYIDGIDYMIRSANHTKPNDEETETPVYVDFRSEGWESVEVDLSKGNLSANDFKEIVKEVALLKENGGVYKRGDYPTLDKYAIVSDKTDGDIRYSISAPVFYSNAAKAVEGIKQNKATGEQWLAMIKKNGGLKAEEDKWMGLSDWLKDQKSVTKEDVLMFIAENDVKVEEVEYRNEGDSVQDLYDVVTEKYGEQFAADFSRAFEIDSEGFPWLDNKDVAVKLYESVHDDKIDRDALNEDLTEAYFNEEAKLVGWVYQMSDLRSQHVINGTRLRYTTDGLTNKREIALTVPAIEPYNTSDEIHFGDADEGRAVAWLRFGDAYEKSGEGKMSERSITDEMLSKYGNTDAYDKMSIEDAAKRMYVNWLAREEHADKATSRWEINRKFGERADEVFAAFEKILEESNKPSAKVLVIDEIQSKRHQDGREKGYGDMNIDRLVRDAEDKFREYSLNMGERINRGELTPEQAAIDLEDLKDEIFELKRKQSDGVPDAPFQKNWHELAMKRALRYAAENGYDKVAWTTGAQQAERYGLGGVVDFIETYQDPAEGKVVFIRHKGGNQTELLVDENGVVEWANTRLDIKEGTPLADIIGKELAQDIVDYNSPELKRYQGDGLQIGGEGMKGFYDKMLPSFMQKYGKKWGAKVGEVELDLPNEADRKMWSVDVTPEMKESVMQGQPKFSFGTNSEEAPKPKTYTERMTEARAHAARSISDLTGKVFRGSDTEGYRNQEAARKAVKDFVKIGLDAKNMPQMGKMQLNKIMTLVENVKSPKALRAHFVQAERIIQDCEQNRIREQIDKLLTMKKRGVNSKNISIAKSVDERARLIYEALRNEGEVSQEERADLNRKFEAEIQSLTQKYSDDSQVMTDADYDRLEALTIMKQINDANMMEDVKVVDDNGQVNDCIQDLKARQKQLIEANKQLRRDLHDADERDKDIIKQRINVNSDEIDTIDTEINAIKDKQIQSLRTAQELMEGVVGEGRERLKDMQMAEKERRGEIAKGAYNDIKTGKDWKQYKRNGEPVNTSERGWFAEKIHQLFVNPLNSFVFMTQKVSNGLSGQGFLYKRFIEGDDGVVAANSNHVAAMKKAADMMNEAAKRFTGHDFVTAQEKLKSMKDKDCLNVTCSWIDTDKDGAEIVRFQDYKLNKGNMMYISQLWNMTDGKMKLSAMGFTEEHIQEMRDFLGDDLNAFCDWMVDEYYPQLQKRVDKVHREIYFTSMSKVDNYVPIRIDRSAIAEDSNMVEGGAATYAETLKKKNGSIINRTVNRKPIDISRTALDVLAEHTDTNEEWAAYARVRQDLDYLMSSISFRNQLNANSHGMYRDFEKSVRLAVNLPADMPSPTDQLLNAASAGFVSGAIGFRISTALKQLLSFPAFYGYSLSPKYAALLTASLFNPTNYSWAKNNIPSFQKRIEEGLAANSDLARDLEALGDNAYKKVMTKYAKIGMLPNKLVDAITCAAGARAIYQYEYDRMKKRGYSEEQAHDYAVRQADIAYNETQQSNVKAFKSDQQVSSSWGSKMVTMFQNSNLGFTRKTYLAVADVLKGMKNHKALISKYAEDYDVSQEEAKSAINGQLRHSVVLAGLMGIGVKYLWDMGNEVIANLLFGGWGDDDDKYDEEEESDSTMDIISTLSQYAGYFTQGTIGGNALHDLATNGKYNPFSIVLESEASKIGEVYEKYKVSPELALQILSATASMTGLKLDTWMNAYIGAEDMIMNGFDKNMAVDIALILNMPKSTREHIARTRKMNYDPMEYAKAMAFARKQAESAPMLKMLLGNVKNLTDNKFNSTIDEWQRSNVGKETFKAFQEGKKDGGVIQDAINYTKHGLNAMTKSQKTAFEEAHPDLNYTKCMAIADMMQAYQDAGKLMKDHKNKAQAAEFDKYVKMQGEIIQKVMGAVNGGELTLAETKPYMAKVKALVRMLNVQNKIEKIQNLQK